MGHGDLSVKPELREELKDWAQAVQLLGKFEAGGAHLDDLLESALLGRSRWLVMETFRRWCIIDRILKPCLGRKPRPVAHNLLRLAVAECLVRDPETWPRVVHHAIEVARLLKLSKPETGFLNAVLRRILREDRLQPGSLEETHPAWLVERWQAQFGRADAQALLEWNQTLPPIYLSAPEKPEYAEVSRWPGFYELPAGRFQDALADLEAGRVYVQDPFTRIPVEMLHAMPGETVLDLCAAPGGKSRLIAQGMSGRGRLIMVDRPGTRLERLRANAALFCPLIGEVIGVPLEELESAGSASQLEPGSIDAVLVDVPCSNTGVMSRRPDVKLRLKSASIGRHAAQQLGLLREAARWVRPGGRLVYSTCSLEKEENDDVIAAFCEDQPEWSLGERRISLPWECGHDGGGAFLLTKQFHG